MGAVLKRSGVSVTDLSLWDEISSRQLGESAVSTISLRVHRDGLDVDDQPFEKYSTKATYIQKDNARLTPRGGHETKGGKSVFYPEGEGYEGYKQQTTGVARVNLVLSGQLQRSLAVMSATRTRIIIGVRGGAARHGAYLQIAYKGRPARRWFGLSPRNTRDLQRALAVIWRGALQRGMRGAR